MSANEPDRSAPELIPLNQGFTTRWLVSCAAAAAEEPGNPYAGWFDVDADGRDGTVELWGNEMTPTEARNLAAALIEAARHAESYWAQLASALSDQQMFVERDLGPDSTLEERQAVNKWFRAAHARVYAQRPKLPQERAVLAPNGGTGVVTDYELRDVDGTVLDEFEGIDEARQLQRGNAGSQIFARTVTTTVVRGEWAEVSGV